MHVSDSILFKLGLELVPSNNERLGRNDLLLVNLFKDVLESTIILLQNGVFGAQIKRPFLHEGIVETRLSEPSDGLDQ